MGTMGEVNRMDKVEVTCWMRRKMGERGEEVRSGGGDEERVGSFRSLAVLLAD